MLTLDINAAYRDCSAVILRDGVVLAGAEEERFKRIKHGKRPVPFSTWQLPFHAIDYHLREAGVILTDLEHVAYAFDPGVMLGEAGRQARISLPLESSAYASEWLSPLEPLFLSSIVNAPRQLGCAAHRSCNSTTTLPARCNWYYRKP